MSLMGTFHLSGINAASGNITSAGIKPLSGWHFSGSTTTVIIGCGLFLWSSQGTNQGYWVPYEVQWAMP